jgi:phage recombination protein Bet
MTPAVNFEREAELIAAEAARTKRQALPAVVSAPVVTAEQHDLITRTVAAGATPDELKLYLFDCARQGVHPLDKLIHFTVRTDKRGNRKYTPVTSIDFMRIRAAETNEYVGSDDATFGNQPGPYPDSATVTVWRLVQGTRGSFTATARWPEYYPGDGDGSFLWRKMPHTMLAKCAEALALRKGFPRQLAGLYAKEEMDQAGPSNGDSLPAPTPAPAVPPQGTLSGGATRPLGTGEIPSSSTTVPDKADANVYAPADWRESENAIPADAYLITKAAPGFGEIAGFLFHHRQAVGEDGIPIWKADQYAAARAFCYDGEPVRLEFAMSKKSGKAYVKTVRAYAPF